MFKKFFKKTYSENEQNQIDQLKSFWLFDDFSDDELYLLIPFIYHRTYSQDEIIFFQEDPAQSIYFLKTGEIKLYLEVQNNEEELTQISDKTAFGENAVFNNSRRNYSAQVISSKADVFMIPHVSVENIFENDARLKSKLFYNVANKYYEFSRRLVHSYSKDQGFFEIKHVYQEEQF